MHIFNYVVDADFFCQKSMKLHQYTRQGVAICWSYRQMKCALLAKCYTPSKSPECVKILQINHHLHCFQVRTFNWRRTRKNFNKYMLILVCRIRTESGSSKVRHEARHVQFVPRQATCDNPSVFMDDDLWPEGVRYRWFKPARANPTQS